MTLPAGTVLRYVPAAGLVTLTDTMQVAAAPTLPPERETSEPPDPAETVPDPHVVLAFGTAAIVTPLGS
jgi:hypothetical protein